MIICNFCHIPSASADRMIGATDHSAHICGGCINNLKETLDAEVKDDKEG